MDSLNDEDESFELDATEMFKQEAAELTTVKNLEDALNRFGFSKDDRISRRELVLIYTQIKKEMEREIFNLANSTSYSKAKEMRSRLTNLRHEFDNLQVSGVQMTRNEQVQSFNKASHEILNDVQNRQSNEVNELTQFLENKKTIHSLFDTIDSTKLEQTISKIPTAKVRYSKRMIELFRAEYNLNKLKQYDEAIKVRRMIDKILPNEEKQFHDNFNQNIENRRRKLLAAQQVDQTRLEEKLKKMEWDDLRRRDMENSITNQRLKNHLKDMSHTHRMEEKLRPEMSVKPSALWQHRQGYNNTSASLRGQQLLDHARGKKNGEFVFADTLVDKHDFHNIPENTTTLYMSQKLL